MGKYIDKSAVVAEIEARYNECLKRAKLIDAEYWNGKADAYRDMLVVLDTLEVKEIEPTKVPKYSYFETIYNCGTEPMWKIGDVLAVYEFFRDSEGEHVYGEVIDVKMDETYEDWVYTIKGDFGGYEDIYENELISEQAYKKNK